MKKYGVIYIITNKINGKQYVGQTRQSAAVGATVPSVSVVLHGHRKSAKGFRFRFWNESDEGKAV